MPLFLYPPCGSGPRWDATQRATRPPDSGPGQKPADEVQVRLHVLFHIARRRHGLQLRPAAEPGPGNGLDDFREINLPLPEKVRVVLQMKLADAVLAEPGDFLVDVETVVERVADIIVNQHGLRLRAVENARIVFG